MKNTSEMTLGRKMAVIRNKLKMTQKDLYMTTGTSISLIGQYENNKSPVSPDVFKKFKKELKLEDIPLSDDEVAAFKKDQLNAWNFMINFGDIEKAKELQPTLTYRVKWSHDVDLRNLFDLYSINYNCVIGEREEAGRLATDLKKREQSFTDEHLYWYYRYLGNLEHWNWRYKAAVTLYMKAEDIGNRYNLNDKALYYNVGNCFTYMDYPYRAIVYLEKVQIEKFDASNITFGFAVQRLLAINYSKLGRIDEALELIEGYRNYLMNEKKDYKLGFGRVYHCICLVYQEAGNYEKALENLDMAFRYCDEKSEQYIRNLCSKASLLRTINRNDEVAKCLSKGLPMVTEGTLWSEWLHALKHSLTLDKQSSVDYLEYTSIPRLRDYGKHALVIECHRWLSSYYKENGKYRPAGEYSDKAAEIYKKLMKGDLSL